MFHDLMLLKLQVMHGQHTEMLFHSHWAGADIVPINGAAESTDQVGDMYYYPSSESTVAWNYGANFGGKTKTDGSWKSGADSVTAATVAENLTNYDLSGKAGASGGPPAWAVGMFGKYMIADPSYSGANGGFGGNTDYYPLNGNATIPMCGGDGGCLG